MSSVGLSKQRRLMKTEWFAQPHDMRHSFFFELDDETLNSTIYPIAMYDEGRGTPSANESNPENSAFLVDNNPNCFVNSRVDNVFCSLKFSMTSKAIDDNLPVIRFAVMPIHTAFIDAYTAIDELTSLEIQDVLMMQTESTDRQGFPLYIADKKMVPKFSGSNLMNSLVPGLTTTQQLESVAFATNSYYDMLHYLTNGAKLKSVQSGLKWYTVTPNRPTKEIRIHIKSNVKRMNEFTFFGALIHVPTVDTFNQPLVTGDITAATNYLLCDIHCRFNEWNQDFNFKKV